MPISSRSTFALLVAALMLAACSGWGDRKNDDDATADADPAGEAVGEPSEPAVGGTPAPAVVTLDEVRKAFDARKESFRRANSARLSQNAGTFAVTMTFAPSGEVVECRMLSTDFSEDPAFNAAVMAEVWRVRIAPRPADAGEFTVDRYSIPFSARTEAEEMPLSVPKLSPGPSTQPQVWVPRSNWPR